MLISLARSRLLLLVIASLLLLLLLEVNGIIRSLDRGHDAAFDLAVSLGRRIQIALHTYKYFFK